MKSMKPSLAFGCLLFLLTIYGCNRCGKNIHIGDYKLMPGSRADWFPYTKVKELNFSNSAGRVITLKNKTREEAMNHQGLREICRKGFGDYAEEFIRLEWLNYEYYGSFNGIDYAIQIILTVDSPKAFALYDPEADLDLILYDRISYSSSVSRGTVLGMGGGVDIVASYRGNSIHDDDIAFLYVINFAEEIEINGVPYKDVWYWDRAGTPSLYVQKYHGIIAFAGMDGEVWVLQ